MTSHETHDVLEPDLPCNVFVELVTDYLEGALPAEQRELVDAHLTICAGCATVLDQWHMVISLTGRIAREEVDRVNPVVRRSLMEAFARLRPPGAPPP